MRYKSLRGIVGSSDVEKPAQKRRFPNASRGRGLMVQASRGDLAAFSEIVRTYQAPLLNYFLRSGAYYQEAEDLVQETFLRLYRYRERYRPVASFHTFLYTLARNARADALRKAGRDPARGTGSLPDEDPPQPDRTPLTGARLDLDEALGRLSEKLRSTVVLTAFQGLSYPEAAEVLGIPLGTVKSRIFIALRKLRKWLEEGEEDA
jgi:RNA polymerase sigma-70 factor (ECF subfamily)